jgi:uncharacterized SAM-binding protein YcdF (DUF218 family)
MGFIITKILLLLLLPPTSILALMFLGFLLVWSHRLLGRLLITAAFLLLYGLSISPVSDALITPLEADYRPLDVMNVRADVIVVLGGGAVDLSALGLEPMPSNGSLERVVAAVKLYRTLHIPMVITGGAGDPAMPQLSDAEPMARMALDLGVPKQEIMIDNTAFNTLASARNVKTAFAGKRMVLVTSAYHLKRSVGMFRKLGLEVVPQPSGFLSGKRGDRSFYAAIPRLEFLNISSIALSERISLTWYRFRKDL